jgi:hypothetical protein
VFLFVVLVFALVVGVSLASAVKCAMSDEGEESGSEEFECCDKPRVVTVTSDVDKKE